MAPMSGINDKKNQDNNNDSDQLCKKQSAGVADYFAILGVGEDLLWKHTQKQREQQQQTKEENDREQEGKNGPEHVLEKSDRNKEDQAALLERFYREIIDISILIHYESPTIPSYGVNTLSSAAPESSIILASSASCDTDADNSVASSHVKAGIAHLLPSPSSHSEATTVATTAVASYDACQPGAPQPPSEINGFTVLSRTYPLRKSAPGVYPSSCWTPGSGTSSHHHPSHPLSSSFSHGAEFPSCHAPPPGNQSNCTANNQNPYVFDADLGGLRERVCSSVLQWEGVPSEHHNSNSNASVSGSSATSLTQGLRRKVESSLKRWHPQNHQNPSKIQTLASQSSMKFYVGYKRRTPDQDHVPAIADLQLLYVRLPRDATTSLPPIQRLNISEQIVATPPGSSTSGLAGRVAAGVGNVLFRNSAETASPPHCSILNNNPDDYQAVDLEPLLELPEGFDKWSIPERYKTIYIPKAHLKQKEDRRPKTVLVASPSHGQRRRRRAPNSNDDETLDLNNSKDSTGEDYVEAYMEMAPDSSNPQEDEKSSKEDSILPTDTESLPLLFSEIPWSDDDKELYWYLPVLAVRQQRAGEEERFHEDAGITDLAVSFCDKAGFAFVPQETQNESHDDMMTEEESNDLSLLSKTNWTVISCGDNSCIKGEEPLIGIAKKWSEKKKGFTTLKKVQGSPTILVKRNVPFGFADLAFATRVLDRFPFKNYKGLPLPEEELPMFCYPTGCRLHRARYSEAPLPEYYGFVVKNERGDSIYISCVSFMEPLTRQKTEQLANMSEKRRRTSLANRHFCEKRERKRRRAEMQLHTSEDPHITTKYITSEEKSDSEDSQDGNCILTGFETMTTFENKTICLVSRYPFWTAFRRFLSHLHLLSGDSSDLPLERCISHLLLSVPVPKPGGPSVVIPLPTLNEPMVLSLPSLKDFPLVDLPYQRLVSVLDIPTIVTVVLGFLALEKKVLIKSSRPSLVLDNCELLRSLLFPFDLCAPYVPRLTEPFMSCLDFPGAIFAGIHDDGSPAGLAAVVKNSPPEDSIIVDLDTGNIDCSGNRYEVLASAWDIIPATARSNLVSELETLCRDAGIVPGQEPLESVVDPAFDAPLPYGLVEDYDTLPENQTREPLDDRAVRDSFLRFFCALMRGYERFLVVPDADFLISGNEWFDAENFLSSAPKGNVPYLKSLASTQLFQSFIQRRTEDSDIHCLMFDECLNEYHSSPVPYGRLGGDVESIVSSENSQPHMLYSLLVDQSASATHSALASESPNIMSAQTNTAEKNGTEDNLSQYEAGSDVDTSSSALSKTALSTITDVSEHRKNVVELDSIRHAESIMIPSGDIVTAPSRQYLTKGMYFAYCVDGNPCFPHRLNKSLFLPREPDSLLVEMSKCAPNPSLARSEREVEEANRRRKAATSYRGFHAQKRCLWQLPKLMGSHFLGSWLLCVPAQISQSNITHEQQSRFLLRALGALRLLRHKQRIIPDEAAYRALMVACGRTSSDRRVELVKLFGLLRSDGIFPSAVTLGQYTRALAEGYSKRSAPGLPEENANDFIGTEDAASAGRSAGAMGEDRGRSRPSNLYTTRRELETSLFSMDGNLINIECAGRKWQQRNSDRTKPSNSGNATSNERAQPSDMHRKRSHRSWLPACVSSSFVPSDASKSNDCPANAWLSPDDLKFIALWSRTCSCDSCGYIPLEEEVQAGWDVVAGESDVLGAISCPRCGSMIIPMLGYREMSTEEALSMKDPAPQNINDADFSKLPPQVGPFVDPGKNKASFVTYINPSALRLSLERYIDEIGEGVLSRERLRQLDPEVFYNLFWYCARFNLPLPLPVLDEGEGTPSHCIAFAAWDRTAAERGCYSGARAISTLFAPEDQLLHGPRQNGEMGAIDPFEEYPLLGRYNLQGFHPSVWDHPDLSEILVSLVTVCDSERRDFKDVVECVLRCNQRRRVEYSGEPRGTGSDIDAPFDFRSVADDIASLSTELDCYKTILYLAKYQCTTAFHAFFPAVAKPCKGYHFWCAIGTPLPIFDRLLREAVKSVNSKNNTFAPIPDVSDIALGFRCVFGHLI